MYPNTVDNDNTGSGCDANHANPSSTSRSQFSTRSVMRRRHRQRHQQQSRRHQHSPSPMQQEDQQQQHQITSTNAENYNVALPSTLDIVPHTNHVANTYQQSRSPFWGEEDCFYDDDGINDATVGFFHIVYSFIVWISKLTILVLLSILTYIIFYHLAMPPQHSIKELHFDYTATASSDDFLLHSYGNVMKSPVAAPSMTMPSTPDTDFSSPLTPAVKDYPLNITSTSQENEDSQYHPQQQPAIFFRPTVSSINIENQQEQTKNAKIVNDSASRITVPTATIDLLARHNEWYAYVSQDVVPNKTATRLLHPKQGYFIEMDLFLPESDVNKHAGIFSVVTTLYSSSTNNSTASTTSWPATSLLAVSRRSCRYPHRTSWVETIWKFVQLVPLLLGAVQETRIVTDRAFRHYIEHPLYSLDRVVIQLILNQQQPSNQQQRVEVTGGILRIGEELSTFQEILRNDWFYTSAIVGIATFALLYAITFVCISIIIRLLFGGNNSERQDRDERRRQQQENAWEQYQYEYSNEHGSTSYTNVNFEDDDTFFVPCDSNDEFPVVDETTYTAGFEDVGFDDFMDASTDLPDIATSSHRDDDNQTAASATFHFPSESVSRTRHTDYILHVNRDETTSSHLSDVDNDIPHDSSSASNSRPFSRVLYSSRVANGIENDFDTNIGNDVWEDLEISTNQPVPEMSSFSNCSSQLRAISERHCATTTPNRMLQQRRQQEVSTSRGTISTQLTPHDTSISNTTPITFATANAIPRRTTHVQQSPMLSTHHQPQQQLLHVRPPEQHWRQGPPAVVHTVREMTDNELCLTLSRGVSTRDGDAINDDDDDDTTAGNDDHPFLYFLRW